MKKKDIWWGIFIDHFNCLSFFMSYFVAYGVINSSPEEIVSSKSVKSSRMDILSPFTTAVIENCLKIIIDQNLSSKIYQDERFYQGIWNANIRMMKIEPNKWLDLDQRKCTNWCVDYSKWMFCLEMVHRSVVVICTELILLIKTIFHRWKKIKILLKIVFVTSITGFCKVNFFDAIRKERVQKYTQINQNEENETEFEHF